MRWKYFLAFLLLFLLLLPAYSESETEFTVPDLIPTEEYVMTGQDLITLYTTIQDLNETKNSYKNLTDEMMTTSQNALKLAKEYASENQKLVLQNNFLVGGITISAGIIIVGTVVLIVDNIK